MDTGQTDTGQTDTGQTRLTLPASVRVGAALLWIASGVWTTVSVHHVIGVWTTSVVVTAVIESAYVLAMIWFHHSRSRVSAVALVVALVPVVGALAVADYDMFGPIGVAFAFGPLIAEGGFLLAAHLNADPAALTAEQRVKLAAVRRQAAYQAALRAAQLEADLADDRAEVTRQMAKDLSAAEAALQRNDLNRRLVMSAPLVRPADTDNGQADTVSGQLSDTVRPEVADSGQTDAMSGGQTTVRPVSAPARLSAVRPGGLSGAVRTVLADDPEISNADLTERVSEILGAAQKPDSVAKTRKRQSA